MAEVSIRELKSHLSEHLRRVSKGECITITRRGKAVGMIVPPAARQETDAVRIRRKMLALKERGILAQVGEGKPKGLSPPIKLKGEGPTMSEMIIEDRG